MGRRNRRSEASEFELYSSVSALGVVKLIGRCSAKEGDDLVREGKAKLIFHEESGRYVFQMVGEKAKEAIVKESDPSSCVLSEIEVEAAVGWRQSETAGLSDSQRKVIESLGGTAYDFVERSQFKLQAFNPALGRVVRVQPIQR